MATDGKTERPTQRRREEARRKGQVARSREIGSALGLFAALLALRFAGPALGRRLACSLAGQWEHLEAFDPTPHRLVPEMWGRGAAGVLLLVPMVAAVVALALLTGFAQTRGLLSSQPLAPDWDRVNPISGFKRLASRRTAVELCKTLAKTAIIATVVIVTLRSQGPFVLSLGASSPAAIMAAWGELAFAVAFRVALALVVLAAADYAYQRWEFEKQLRMSRQELKDEFRETEGDPHIKARLRQIRARMREERTEAATATATTLVTNPMHLAVALRYVPPETQAPVVVAKGRRLRAKRMVDIAREHDVPIVQNPPVARALFDGCEVGDSIPEALYRAVAEIVAWVYRLEEQRQRVRRGRAGATESGRQSIGVE
jgi:flagellar biosynthetic protein FlhB